MGLIKRAKRDGKKIGEAILKPLKDGIIPVDDWVPSEEDRIVYHSGKVLIIDFDKIFNRPSTEKFKYFDLSCKEAYYSHIELIIQYINYFEKFYDKDKELIMAYAKLKYTIDAKGVNFISRKSMIHMIKTILFTESLCNKIKQMSIDNYRVQLIDGAKQAKKYAPVLQFTERHAEILMRISVGIKFTIPILLHYIKVFQDKNEVKYHLYDYFEHLFLNKIFVEDVNILGKLHHAILSRVNTFSKTDKKIYDKHEALGSSTDTFVEDLFRKNLMTDTIYSYKFNGNIISYNAVVLKYQLTFHSKEDLKRDFSEVSYEKNEEGLSDFDKMEMFTTKIDSFSLLFSQTNIEQTIRRLTDEMKLKIDQKEIDFYLQNHDFNVISKTLLFYYFGKDFGGLNDLKFVKKPQYVKLMIIAKERLERNYHIYLNQLISANITGKTHVRLIRNVKFIESITNSSIYQDLMINKYASIDLKNINNPILTLLSKLLNTNWLTVDYKMKESLNKPLTLNSELLAAEFIRFIEKI